MNSSYVSRHGVGSLAALAAALALLVGLGGDNSSPAVAVRQPQEPRAEAPRYVGDVPLPLSESAHPVLQTTPEELVATVVAARARRDLAALSRCCSQSVGRVALDQFDAARAERDFYDPEVMMERFEAAVQKKALRIEQRDVKRGEAGEDGLGTIAFATGMKSLPEVQMPIVRIGGAWYLKVSP